MSSIDIIRSDALPIDPSILLPTIHESKVVMIGDNTHGTAEFYNFRAAMTKSLILNKGFTIIGIEWDWIDVHYINLYIHGMSPARNAWDALKIINRFPRFMYQNHEFADFVEWLKQYNTTTNSKVSIYGLDIFGFPTTIQFLTPYYPQLKYAQQVLDQFGEDEYAYGDAAQKGRIPSLEPIVNNIPPTQDFFMDKTIKLLKETENYYRQKSLSETNGWNLRDTHMAETVLDLLNYHRGKMVCWLHNTHSGASRTISEFNQQHEVSAASLLKSVLGSQVYCIGLLSYAGTVTASNKWYGSTINFKLNPSIDQSYGKLFHDALNTDFMLILRDSDPRLLKLLSTPHYERFIGGSYDPVHEIESHYVHAQLYPQFDAIVFYNYTHSFVNLN